MTHCQDNSKLAPIVAFLAACLALCLAGGASASSNLVFDGVHAFQYDGFGRVVQINRASLPANAPPEIASLVVGGIVKHYTYDAFGRLIRVQSPFPDPESGGDLGLRVERLYYDGLRRVQEVNIDPSVSMNMAMSGQAGGEMQAAANQVAVNAEEPLDGSAAPATLESQALESEVIPATVTYLAREYVWGPGDWGVDELLAQYDADRRASWPLQDAGGDVIALCDRGGANGTAASVGKELRVGHKGLFFDRLDSGISDPATGQETPRLWPGARLSGYARNRTLHCNLGRWNQPDPNMTGLAVQVEISHHGQGLLPRLQEFDLQGLYGDGANFFLYLRGRPLTAADPTGLQYDPFDDAFEIAWEHALSGMSVLSLAKQFSWEKVRKIRAYERGGWAFDELIMDRDEAMLFSMVVGPFFSSMCFEEGTPVATPLGPEAIECLALGREVISAEDPVQSSDGVEIPPGTERISLVRMRYHHADGCSTLIEILRPTSLVDSLAMAPGRQLSVALPDLGLTGAAEVVSVESFREAIRLDVPVVTGRFITESAEVVHVYFNGYERPLGVTPNHPVFSSDRETWVHSGELRSGERVKSTNGVAVVARVELSPVRVKVHNVEVSHYHTYFVGDAGVWAHNPCQLSGEAEQLVKQFKSSGQLGERSLAAFRLGGEMRIGSSHYDIIQSFRSTNFSGWSHGYVRWVNGEWIFRAIY